MRTRPIPAAHTVVGRLLLLSLGLLISSCGGSSGSGDTPTQPEAPLGNDASLSALSIGDEPLYPDFSPSETVYQSHAPYYTTDVSLSVTANDVSASLTVIIGATRLTNVGDVTTDVPLNVGQNRIDIIVTAEDGTNTQTYTIGFFRQVGPGAEIQVPPDPPLGSDASLSYLWVDRDYFANLNPAFRPYFTVYKDYVADGTREVFVSATANDAGASVTIVSTATQVTGTGDATAVVPITLGHNRIDVFVTARDGTTERTYTIDVERQPSINRYLRSLVLSDAALVEPFHPHRQHYTAIARSLTSSIDVHAIPDDVNASATINGGTDTNVPIAAGDNTIVIVVTAENPAFTYTYNIVVTRPAADNANLSNLKLPIATWDQPFDTNQFEYALTVGYFSRSLQIVPTTEDADATISINGTVVASGAISEPIALSEGDNIVTIDVTSADGTTARTYTVSVNRQSALDYAQTAYIKASNSGTEDEFGWSVSLSEDGATLAVGAPFEDSAATGVNGDEADNSDNGSGATYVFVRDDVGDWTQQAYIKASARNAGPGYEVTDRFGESVALSRDGSTLAVGAPLEDGFQGGEYVPGDFPHGAVYVFTRDTDGFWTQQSFVKPSNTVEAYSFGGRVALSGDGTTLAAANSGHIYLFAEEGGVWTQQADVLARPIPPRDCAVTFCFADSLALSDDGATLAAAATGDDSAATGVNGDETDDSARDSGAVHLFTRDGDAVWTRQAYIKASNTKAGAQFGLSVALSGDGEILAATNDHGEAYLFAKEGGVWNQQAYIKASDTDRFDSLAMSRDGTTLAAGATNEDSSATGVDGDEADNAAANSGAVYLFTRDGEGTWNTRTYVKASNTDAGDAFGAGVALSADGTTLAVGAVGEDSGATGVDGDEADNGVVGSGAAYTFELEEGL